MQTDTDQLAREIAQPTITLTLAPWHASLQFAGPGDDEDDMDLDDEDFEDLDDEDWEDDEDLDEDEDLDDEDFDEDLDEDDE